MFLYPEKVLRFGLLILAAVTVLTGCFILFGLRGGVFSPVSWGLSAPSSREASSFSLGLKKDPLPLIYPNIEGEIDLIIYRQHPALQHHSLEYNVRLKKNGSVKKVSLPARICLCYENGLKFSDEESPFWLELDLLGDGRVLIQAFASTMQEAKSLVGSLTLVAEEPPFRNFNELLESSPLRPFTIARYLGIDLVLMRQKEEQSLYRLEVGKDMLKLTEGDLFVWADGKWCKNTNNLSDLQDRIVARIVNCSARDMVVEAWEKNLYHRFLIPIGIATPFKTKTAGLLTAVRVRSEKQISCMLEKQCLIVQVGDWALKGDHRWKILRKQEEKEAYLQDHLEGELLVFDRVEVKNGQKVVMGSFFNADHSQMMPIEVEVHSQGSKRKTDRERK